jgi:hypothetical protein
VYISSLLSARCTSGSSRGAWYRVGIGSRCSALARTWSGPATGLERRRATCLPAVDEDARLPRNPCDVLFGISAARTTQSYSSGPEARGVLRQEDIAGRALPATYRPRLPCQQLGTGCVALSLRRRPSALTGARSSCSPMHLMAQLCWIVQPWSAAVTYVFVPDPSSRGPPASHGSPAPVRSIASPARPDVKTRLLVSRNTTAGRRFVRKNVTGWVRATI